MDAPRPVAQLRLVVGVVEREHRRRMRHLDESLSRLAAHALGRRIRRDQLRMRQLNRLQFVHQDVVISIADLRVVEHVVAVLVMANQLAQFQCPPLNFQARLRHGTDYKLPSAGIPDHGVYFPDHLLFPAFERLVFSRRCRRWYTAPGWRIPQIRAPETAKVMGLFTWSAPPSATSKIFRFEPCGF